NDLGADLSVACMRVPLNEASSFGIMSVDGSGSVTAFQEKPTDPSPMAGVDDAALASMGIYIFNTDILIEELTNDHADRSSSHDFGNDILPRMIKSHKVCGYQFGSSQGRVTPDRYWRDVGTIDSYFDANMDLLQTEPPLDLYQDTWPIRTYHGQHPPARVVTSGHIDHAGIHNSILGAGSMVIDAAVKRSILSARVRVGANADLDSAIVFDHASIGEGAKLNRCIVDKYVTIPAGTIIGYDKEEDEKRYTVSAKGVVVVSGQS
ncbi:MAG: glucose-1-phosphate adenylyltransferase, partial [Gammaproteobacteria bacterium]|nr:glucose-1-phosphate adenylyltransferase [Gammaproteobacteria bacterium]